MNLRTLQPMSPVSRAAFGVSKCDDVSRSTFDAVHKNVGELLQSQPFCPVKIAYSRCGIVA